MTTIEEVEEQLYPGRAEATVAPPESWPALLRLAADILQDALPLLEGGKKADVFQLLMTFAKLQVAWRAFKSLRKPVAVVTGGGTP